jgi:hypothetical protein
VLLADGVIVIVVGLMLVGIVGFFFMAVALLARLFHFVFRSLFGTSTHRVSAPGPVRTVACPAPRCGHMNPVGARYCGRCGRPLGRHDDVDAYG